MSNNQLNIYYRKEAEEQLKFEYEQEISKINTKNNQEKQKIINSTKKEINDKYQNEDKTLKNKYISKLEIEYANIEKEFENILEIFDKETDKLTISMNDEKLTENIIITNYKNNEEYQQKIRDTLRNYKRDLRKIKHERRTLRRNLINDIIELKQEKKENAKIEIDKKYNEIFTEQKLIKNNSINNKILKINRIWDDILKANINSFNNKWKINKEEKIQTIITQLINKNKSRIINKFSQFNQSTIIDMTEILNNRLLTDWKIEKEKKIKYKLRNLDVSIKSLKNNILKEWKIKEKNINQKYDTELHNKLLEIDNSIEKYNNTTIQNYKNSILNTIEISIVSLDRNDFQTEEEYAKKLRDEERQKNHELRKMKKKLRKNKIIPDNIKKQLEIYKKERIKEKSSIKEKYKNQKLYDIRNLLQKRDDNIIYEVKKLTEKLTSQAEQEVDILKESWISKKKEECILLNKVQDNNILEIQIIKLNEQLRTKNSIINELQQKTEKLLKENKQFQTEITKLNKYITQYKKDKDFVDKLKVKYMEKENLKTKDQEKISQNVVNQTQEVDNSLRTLTAKKKSSKIVSKIGQKNKKEMEKKLLMKMTLREKGPLFEHNYICTGIYREETDFEILIKAKNNIIIHLKFDSKSNFVNIITSDTNISLSYILEKDTYYEIIFAFNNKNITININNIPLGTYELCNQLLEDIIVRIKSTKSIFYHQYIKFIN